MKKLLGEVIEPLFDEIGLSQILIHYNLEATPIVFMGIGLGALVFALICWFKYKNEKEEATKAYLATIFYIFLIGLGFIGFGFSYLK